jgi:hypothetical protein
MTALSHKEDESKDHTTSIVQPVLKMEVLKAPVIKQRFYVSNQRGSLELRNLGRF